MEAAAELDALSFEASNFYHVRDGKPAQDYPWFNGIKLIEPHRETTLRCTRNTRIDQDGPNHMISRETASAAP